MADGPRWGNVPRHRMTATLHVRSTCVHNLLLSEHSVSVIIRTRRGKRKRCTCIIPSPHRSKAGTLVLSEIRGWDVTNENLILTLLIIVYNILYNRFWWLNSAQLYFEVLSCTSPCDEELQIEHFSKIQHQVTGGDD